MDIWCVISQEALILHPWLLMFWWGGPAKVSWLPRWEWRDAGPGAAAEGRKGFAGRIRLIAMGVTLGVRWEGESVGWWDEKVPPNRRFPNCADSDCSRAQIDEIGESWMWNRTFANFPCSIAPCYKIRYDENITICLSYLKSENVKQCKCTKWPCTKNSVFMLWACKNSVMGRRKQQRYGVAKTAFWCYGVAQLNMLVIRCD